MARPLPFRACKCARVCIGEEEEGTNTVQISRPTRRPTSGHFNRPYRTRDSKQGSFASQVRDDDGTRQVRRNARAD